MKNLDTNKFNNLKLAQTFVGKVMSLLFNMLSRFVKAPVSLWTVPEAMKLKDSCSLEGKL